MAGAGMGPVSLVLLLTALLWAVVNLAPALAAAEHESPPAPAPDALRGDPLSPTALLDHICINEEAEDQCNFCETSPWRDVAMQTAEMTAGCDVVLFSSIFFPEGHKRLQQTEMPFVQDQWTSYGNNGTDSSIPSLCPILFANTASASYLQKERSDDVLGWSLVEVDCCNGNSAAENLRRMSRIPKMMAHLFFPSASYIAFFDFKRRYPLDPRDLIEYSLGAHNATFSACWHPMAAQEAQEDRSNEWIFRESIIIENNDATAELTAYREQLRRYQDEEEATPLWIYPEGDFFVYDARALFPRLLTCEWFKEYTRGGDRDQPALAHTLGVHRGVLDIGKVWLAPKEEEWCRSYVLHPEWHLPGGKRYKKGGPAPKKKGKWLRNRKGAEKGNGAKKEGMGA
jgi:hypothetical protein